MKKDLFNRLCIAIAMMASFTGYAQRPQYTICNCSFGLNCSYVVTVDVSACNSTPTCISLTPQTYTLAPGACQDVFFSAPHGYTITPNSVTFHATTLTNTVTADFGYSSTFTTSPGNCYSTATGYVTEFYGNGSGSYTICPDVITHKPGRGRDGENAPARAANISRLSDAGKTGSESFSIYPNPSSDITNVAFTVNQTQEVSIEVYSAMHEKVYAWKKNTMASEDSKVSIEGLPPGMYVLLFTTESGTTSHKFVIKR